MAWNYSGDPSTSDLDAIRFEIGDTDPQEQLLTDSEILYSLEAESTLLGAAARCCEVLAKRFARQADFRLGPQTVWASQRSAAFRELAKELRQRVAGTNSPSMAEMSPPAFKRYMMCNMGTRPVKKGE